MSATSSCILISIRYTTISLEFQPLYVVTAGDLGTTASEVEKSFGGVLDLCSTW